MPKIKLLISYDGTDFHGWQKQKSTPLTVQETLETLIKKMVNSPVTTVASGRTDAGVHALGQVVHVITDKDPSNYKWVKALNSMLPPTIAVKKAWIVPDEFHALLSCQSKVYKYFIWNSPTPTALRQRYTTWISYPLDLDRLNSYAQAFEGTHDFKSFQTKGTEVPTTTRTVAVSRWVRRSPFLIEYQIKADGFLKQMVRNLIGYQLYMHRKGVPASAISDTLAARDRTQASDTAPPQGLFLHSVQYPKSLDLNCRKI